MTQREPLQTDPAAALRGIPSVHELVESAGLAPWQARAPRHLIVEAARVILSSYRDALSSSAGPLLTLEQLAERVSHRLGAEQRPRLRPVVNATGIILHTGLGRAPLAQAVADAVRCVADRYAGVEIDLDTGERGRRIAAVHDLLCALTGAESAVVVNNNAAATLIVLAAVAGPAAQVPKHVIVSRGELIEIGGSFRLPEIMSVSRAKLIEVGTTNKTRLRDYESAIDRDTVALMKVHPSNYRIEGFTESVSLGDLVDMGRTRGLPVIHDIGSGAMFDFERFGLRDEPTAPDSIAAGADLVLFSGDKLLGGPQAGIIVGKREWVERIARHPLMRPLRVDKLTLAALEATLRIHRDPRRAARDLPVLAMAGAAQEELRRRADALADALRKIERLTAIEVEQTTAYLGGGALPTRGIPSAAVRLRSETISEGALARRLRVGDPAVIPRVQDGSVWLDLRTVRPDEVQDLIAAVGRACRDA